MHRYCPLENENARLAYNLQEAERARLCWTTAKQITSRLWLKLQVRLLSNMFLFFIDPGSTHSYISPRVVDIFSFKKARQRKSQLDQLAIGTKRKVSEVVEKCSLVMDGLVTYADLNVLPLGSYDVLVGTNWLEAHIVNF